MSSPIFRPHEVQEDWMDALDNFLDVDSVHTQHDGKQLYEAAAARDDPKDEALPSNTNLHPDTCTPVASDNSTNPSSNESNSKVPPVSSTKDNLKAVSNNPSPSTGNDISPEVRALARSERKRTREKQRRCDVNSQFADLTKLLQKVEEEEEEGIIGPNSSNNPSNRIDLIARTITVLERIHEENGKRRRVICDLREKLDETKKKAEEAEKKIEKITQSVNKPMMMMVPMMIPSPNSSSPSPPVLPVSPAYMHQAMPFCQMQSMPMFSGHPQPGCFPPMFSPMPPQSFTGKQISHKVPPDNHQHFGTTPPPTISSTEGNLAHCA